MYLAIGRQISHQSLKHSWLNNAQNVAFLFLSILIMSYYEKNIPLHTIHICVLGEPGNEAKHEEQAILLTIVVISHTFCMAKKNELTPRGAWQ